MDDTRVTPYPLRLEPNLRKKLQDRADINGVALSQEILSILGFHVGMPTKPDAMETHLQELNKRLENIEQTQNQILDLLESADLAKD